jgi:hypothetical protein
MWDKLVPTMSGSAAPLAEKFARSKYYVSKGQA